MGEWSPDVETLVADVLVRHDFSAVPGFGGWSWHCACFHDLRSGPAPQKLYSEALALAAAHQALEVCTALAAAGVLASGQ